MPYQRLLDDLIRSVRADAALLLDGEGEVAFQSGAGVAPERRPAAATLTALDAAVAKRGGDVARLYGEGRQTVKAIIARHKMGGLDYVARRHAGGSVILRPLKDGYYLVLSLPVDGRIAEGIHHSELTQETLNREL